MLLTSFPFTNKFDWLYSVPPLLYQIPFPSTNAHQYAVPKPHKFHGHNNRTNANASANATLAHRNVSAWTRNTSVRLIVSPTQLKPALRAVFAFSEADLIRPNMKQKLSKHVYKQPDISATNIARSLDYPRLQATRGLKCTAKNEAHHERGEGEANLNPPLQTLNRRARAA